MRETPLILVVDDEPFNVDLLVQELEDMGYDSVSAFNGQEALDQFAAHRPDAVLLDVMMPVLDGFAVCRRLKSDPDSRFVPVIIMTALADIDDRIRGIEAGADDFLTKPVDERELKARLQTALKMKQALDERMGRLHETGRQLAKFVPEIVRKRVEENPHAPGLDKRDEDASILFLDIVGYTILSEKLTPTGLSDLTERYFSVFLDAIHEHDGELSETSGDGMMCVFLHADPVVHARNAAAAARAVLAQMDRLNADSPHPIALHVGVNSGVAAVGSTRYAGRNSERWVFTADGLVTNVAARLASVSAPDEILIGAETARRVEGAVSLGHRALKNIDGPVEVFRLSR